MGTFAMGMLPTFLVAQSKQTPEILPTEKVPGKGAWVSPNVEELKKVTRRVTAKIWFEDQFLGTGQSYRNRIAEFKDLGRRQLRSKVVSTLKENSRMSFENAQDSIDGLINNGTVSQLKRHWIINGFTCVTTVEKLDSLKAIPGVKKIFVSRVRGRRGRAPDPRALKKIDKVEPGAFDPKRFKHPWYVQSLLADRVWSEFGLTGQGTLNVVHDFNFAFPENLKANLYHNPGEIPGNGKDDDGNGLVDDIHGYNFEAGSGQISVVPGNSQQNLHGTTCANIICGPGTESVPFEFGIAPEGKWAGVIAGADLESAVEWAILQGADTYSMSFSIPNLGELRSHWRKIMEHGSYCGVYFVSGAGNFAQSAKVPVQMRIPEDIPEVVFAAAGVQRDLSRTPFSSKGPVEWKTEHYQDGRVQKPEVCAFNMGLPMLLPDGTIRGQSANGNSFAGPMFCGSIALMLSADPDLLPWDLKEIITETALDVGPKGVDYETGHGLINCYRAVKEVLRRKMVREGKDSKKYSGRTSGDELDVPQLKKSLATKVIRIFRVVANGNADKVGLRSGDVILKVDDKSPANPQQLIQLIRQSDQDEVTIEILRNEKKLTFELPKKNPGMRLTQEFRVPVFQ